MGALPYGDITSELLLQLRLQGDIDGSIEAHRVTLDQCKAWKISPDVAKLVELCCQPDPGARPTAVVLISIIEQIAHSLNIKI